MKTAITITKADRDLMSAASRLAIARGDVREAKHAHDTALIEALGAHGLRYCRQPAESWVPDGEYLWKHPSAPPHEQSTDPCWKQRDEETGDLVDQCLECSASYRARQVWLATKRRAEGALRSLDAAYSRWEKAARKRKASTR